MASRALRSALRPARTRVCCSQAANGATRHPALDPAQAAQRLLRSAGGGAGGGRLTLTAYVMATSPLSDGRFHSEDSSTIVLITPPSPGGVGGCGMSATLRRRVVVHGRRSLPRTDGAQRQCGAAAPPGRTRDVLDALPAQQLHLEVQRRAAGDLGRAAAVAVCIVSPGARGGGGSRTACARRAGPGESAQPLPVGRQCS